MHLRLGDRTGFDPASIRLTRRMPDGREVAIRLTPDPGSSDPSNPFEQSFVGTFEAGVTPGKGMLKAVLQIEGATPAWWRSRFRSCRVEDGTARSRL